MIWISRVLAIVAGWLRQVPDDLAYGRPHGRGGRRNIEGTGLIIADTDKDEALACLCNLVIRRNIEVPDHLVAFKRLEFLNQMSSSELSHHGHILQQEGARFDLFYQPKEFDD